MNIGDQRRAHAVRKSCLAALLLVCCVVPGPALSATPPFSYMTLNDLDSLAVTIEDVERDLVVYGLSAERLHASVSARLRGAGLNVVDYASAVAAPHAGLLRVRIITNRDAQGFYHLSVKLELRQKIPLQNTAHGFISEVVWTDAQNGVMMASEVEKIDALLVELLGNFVTELQAQRSPSGPQPFPSSRAKRR
jgi:hypothetical protein